MLPANLQGIWTSIAGDKFVVSKMAIGSKHLLGITQAIGSSASGGIELELGAKSNPQPATISYTVRPNYAVFTFNNKPYYRFAASYYESIGGLYLGMSARTVQKLYGKPDTTSGAASHSCWHYQAKGLDVSFTYDLVTQLYLHKESPLKLKRSGLGARDSANSFAKAYKDETNWQERLKISEEYHAPLMIVVSAKDSEYLWLDAKGLRLSGISN